MGPDRAYSIADLRRAARRKLPRLVFDFLEGGTGEEYTREANERDFRQIPLRPSVFADGSHLDTSGSAAGTPLSFPLMVSPMGILTMFHPKGDLAVARAAARAGSIFMHSQVAGASIEDTVEAAGPERVWAQLANQTREENRAYLSRLRSLGVSTIVVSAETIASDKRERDLRNGLKTMPPIPPLNGLISFALHPGWVIRWLTGPKFTFADYQPKGRPMRMGELYEWMAGHADNAAQNGWRNVEQLREDWVGKLVVKGVATPKDALRAASCGADGILVSNLGGRRFDGQPSTISVLPDIVAELRSAGSDVEIYVDGGLRRGSDIVRALALGATAAAAGRPFGYGLGAYGEAGVDRAFELLREEFAVAMKAVGTTTPGAIDANVLSSKHYVATTGDSLTTLSAAR